MNPPAITLTTTDVRLLLRVAELVPLRLLTPDEADVLLELGDELRDRLAAIGVAA